ncbi:MAG: hypothetical protein IJ362_00280 [Oscillospiraceae bacterium]|nr:hypothetical protein [Oscillospiraceae bacterium]
MKSNKIISTTIAMVAAILIGVLGLSKIFETTWQQENTVDNSLNIEINETENNVFDYRYTNIAMFKQEPSSVEYPMNWAIENYIEEFEKYIIKSGINDKPAAISYQQAVNIAGETIKYAIGFTDHQNTVAFVERVPRINIKYKYTDNIDETEELYTETLDTYECMFMVYYEDVPTPTTPFREVKHIEIVVYIDAQTGKVLEIKIRDYRYDRENVDTGFVSESVLDYRTVPSPLKEQLLSDVENILDICNPGEVINRYSIVELDSCYAAYIEIGDTVCDMSFEKGNNNQLISYRAEVSQLLTPYHFQPFEKY